MKTTRRKLFAGLFAAVAGAAAGVGATSKEVTPTIRAGDYGAENIEVYDTLTGEKQELVQAVNIGEGWLEQYEYVDVDLPHHRPRWPAGIVFKSPAPRPYRIMKVDSTNGELVLKRVYGRWGLRAPTARKYVRGVFTSDHERGLRWPDEGMALEPGQSVKIERDIKATVEMGDPSVHWVADKAKRTIFDT